MSVVRPVVADVAVPASVDTPRTERELAEPRWWRTALVALIGAAGLLVVSEALLYSRSHTGSGEAQFWFWVGLLAIVLPCTALLAGRTATRTERVVAVVVLAVLLYLVKVVHDPFTCTRSTRSRCSEPEPCTTRIRSSRSRLATRGSRRPPRLLPR